MAFIDTNFIGWRLTDEGWVQGQAEKPYRKLRLVNGVLTDVNFIGVKLANGVLIQGSHDPTKMNGAIRAENSNISADINVISGAPTIITLGKAFILVQAA